MKSNRINRFAFAHLSFNLAHSMSTEGTDDAPEVPDETGDDEGDESGDEADESDGE